MMAWISQPLKSSAPRRLTEAMPLITWSPSTISLMSAENAPTMLWSSRYSLDHMWNANRVHTCITFILKFYEKLWLATVVEQLSQCNVNTFLAFFISSLTLVVFGYLCFYTVCHVLRELAMDEYNSSIFIGAKITIVLHNTLILLIPASYQTWFFLMNLDQDLAQSWRREVCLHYMIALWTILH